MGFTVAAEDKSETAVTLAALILFDAEAPGVFSRFFNLPTYRSTYVLTRYVNSFFFNTHSLAYVRILLLPCLNACLIEIDCFFA